MERASFFASQTERRGSGFRQLGDDSAIPLVRSAILASSAHNSQPWLFRISGPCVELYADRARNIGLVDPYLREMHLSLGCALENLVIAAARFGHDSAVDVADGVLHLLEEEPKPTRVAAVRLRSGQCTSSPLYDAIPNRRTNRTPYDGERPLPSGFADALLALTAGVAVKTFLFTRVRERERIAELTLARSVIYGDRVEEPRGGKDGFLASSGPMFGVIAVRDRYDLAQTLCAGRVWQRASLLATAWGIASRPDNGAVALIDYERRLQRKPKAESSLAELIGDSTWQPTLIFFMGYAAAAATFSPRRPIADVVSLTRH